MRRIVSIITALILMCSFVLGVSAEGTFTYEGTGFTFTSDYAIDENMWEPQISDDEEDFDYYFVLEELPDVQFDFSVEANVNGYKFIQNMKKDAANYDGYSFSSFSGREACICQNDTYTYSITTYSDNYVFVFEITNLGAESDMQTAIGILNGIEITDKTTIISSESEDEAAATAGENTTGEGAEEGSNTIIIIVAAVAVVAIVVVIILVSKKKK